MSDIFISYASADRPRVKPLVDGFRQQGWSVWWDRTILPGKTWDQAIETALADARCVIVLWSRDSVQSEWVRTEADEAMRRGILVPALLDDVAIPLEFKRLQTSNLTSWSGELPNADFQELVQAVSEMLSNPAPPASDATAGGGLEAQHSQGDGVLRETVDEHASAEASRDAKAVRPSPEEGQAQRSPAPRGETEITPSRPAPVRFLSTRRIGLSLGILLLLGTVLLTYNARVRGHPATAQPGHPETAPPPIREGKADGRPLSTVPPDPKSAIPRDNAMSFNGEWKADVNYGEVWAPVNQIHHERFRFTVVGDEVLGTASLLGVPRAIRDGTIHGRSISFVTNYDLTDGSSGESRYRGTISGDRIQFTFQDSRDGGAMPFAAIRVKP